MAPLKDILKFNILPKKLYLRCSARNKYRRAYHGKERELHLLPFLVDRRKKAVDIGANTGLYTHFLSELSTHVYAFEPHRTLADFLTGAAAGNVTVINKAVSDSDAEQVFYTPVVDGKKFLNIASFDRKTAHYLSDVASSTKGVPPRRQYIEERVETVTLDALRLEDIGFIKVDVEGHELEVLNGAVETVKRCRPVMLIEILEQAKGALYGDIAEFMRSHGYEIVVLERGVLRCMTDETDTHAGRNFIFLPS